MAQTREERDFICQGWQYDPVMRELRVYKRERRGWSAEPLDTVQLGEVRKVVWRRWSQQPAQPHFGGEAMPASLSRIIVTFADGRELTLNENDRDCAEKLASLMAREAGLALEQAGAPDRGLRTTPEKDAMGRYFSRAGKTEVVTDMVVREITASARRFPLRRSRQRIPFSEVRRLELAYTVNLPFEEYAVVAVYGPQEERLPLIVYRSWEGWAVSEEWQQFARELGQEMGVEVRT
ncbi:MAG TPA: hypothetical protein VNL15_00885 [Dehalococcoidia bacterium]|nr:hypothetical protein [Dehalococcoidia bacterium]